MKVCSQCGENKPKSEFRPHRDGVDGLRPDCKACESVVQRKWRENNRERKRATDRAYYVKNRDQQLTHMREWRKRNPDGHRVRQIKKDYGLTLDEYNALIAKGCAICGRQADECQICADHNHRNGKVRAALCNNCNFMLGHAKDDPDRLRAAAEYLEKWFEVHGEVAA